MTKETKPILETGLTQDEPCVSTNDFNESKPMQTQKIDKEMKPDFRDLILPETDKADEMNLDQKTKPILGGCLFFQRPLF